MFFMARNEAIHACPTMRLAMEEPLVLNSSPLERFGEGQNLRLAIKLPVQIHKFCDLADISAGLVKSDDLKEQIRVITR